MRQHFVVSSIGGGNVVGAEWPNIRRFEHFLQLFDVVDGAFNVHPVSISNMEFIVVNQGGENADGGAFNPGFGVDGARDLSSNENILV